MTAASVGTGCRPACRAAPRTASMTASGSYPDRAASAIQFSCNEARCAWFLPGRVFNTAVLVIATRSAELNDRPRLVSYSAIFPAASGSICAVRLDHNFNNPVGTPAISA
jgi:hypothetical protein